MHSQGTHCTKCSQLRQEERVVRQQASRAIYGFSTGFLFGEGCGIEGWIRKPNISQAANSRELTPKKIDN